MELIWKKNSIRNDLYSRISLDGVSVENERGYIKSEISNRNDENRTKCNGKKYLNLFKLECVHNDWSREKKTKLGYQGSENRLLRLKAKRTKKNV